MAETKARFLADTQKADTTAEAFTMPSGRATSNNYVLAMSDISTGTTEWRVTNISPTISGVSGELNVYESGSTGEDGGVLTLTGTDFGTQSDVDSIKIMDSSEGNQVTASSFTVNSTTSITVTFNGGETGYNSWGTGGLASTNWHIQVTKSGLTSNVFSSGKSFTQDPTIASVTQTASGDNNGTLTFNGTGGVFGSYGGQTAGGGQDSNTKLLLNFDRTGGTDIEDSSNTGGDGHKVTATNAVIKASPFGDGKSAMFFDGSDDLLEIDNSTDFDIGSGNYTVEFWLYDIGIADGDGLFNNQTTGGINGWNIRRSSSELNFNHWGSSSAEVNFSSSGAGIGSSNTWRHIAFVKNGDDYKFYIDGKENGSTNTNNTLTASSEKLRIGDSYDGANHSNMYMDEIRIVKGVAVYTGEFTVPTSRLSKTQSSGTNISAITGTATKLLIHSNLGAGGAFYGIESQRSYTLTTDVLPNSTYDDLQTLKDGVETTTYGLQNGQSTGSGLHYTIDLGTGNTAVFNRFFWTQSSYGNTNAHGVWKVQAWNGSSWIDPTGGTIDELGSSATPTDFTNTTAYQKYRILGTDNGYLSSGTDSSPYIYEMGFANTTVDDSSDSDHTITPTGVYHSQGYGGIAPAMTFPASKKLTGSAGIYFDGSGDYLTIPSSSDFNIISTFTLDMWIYPTANTGTFFSRADAYNDQWIIDVDGNNKISMNYYYNSDSIDISVVNSASLVTLNAWNHVAVVRNSNAWDIYVNGTGGATITNTTGTSTTAVNTIFQHNVKIGSGWRSSAIHSPFTGYIDSVRWSNSARYTSNFTTDLPTKIYGAPGPDNPSIGSIEIVTATDDDVNVTYSFQDGTEDNATVLGSSSDLAIASDSTGANKKKGTLTGTLQGNPGSVTNLRIQAKANNDSKRLVEVNETSGVGAIRLDKASNGKPVLFNARRYAGNGIQGREISDYRFSPDLVWIKCRSHDIHHNLYDKVRGVNATDGNKLITNATSDENNSGYGYGNIKAFTSDGFTVENGSNTDGTNQMQHVNESGKTYIAWGWKAGGAPTTDQASQVRTPTSGALIKDGSFVTTTDYWPTSDIYPKRQSVSTTGDFSITRYTGSTNGTNQTKTIPHGLSGTPDFVIIKNLSNSADWIVAHSSATHNGLLSQNLAMDQNWTYGYISGRSSSHVTTHSSTDGTNYGKNTNLTGNNYIMYAWKAVDNVSAFGSYSNQITSDPSSSDPYYCGFKPRLVIGKRTNGANNWWMFDRFRHSSDAFDQVIKPDDPDGEFTSSNWTLTATANGFTTGSIHAIGETGGNYIFAAFA